MKAANDDGEAVAALGAFVASTAVQFSLPIETLAGFTLLNDGWRDAFRAGVLDVDGRRIGIVRIPRFRTAEYPALCEQVHRALAGGATPTKELVAARINAAFLQTLQKRLSQVKAAGAVALIVDVGGNGGGNDLGDWATRLFSARPLRSPSMWLSSGAPSQPYFEVQLKDLRAAATLDPPLSAASQQIVDGAIASMTKLQTEAATARCDLSRVWRERRRRGKQGCTRLSSAGSASGAVDYLDKGAVDARAASAVYWAAEADFARGAWDGPTFVLVDSRTGSAAELFAVILQDQGVARVIGGKTAGMGCGFVDVDGTVTLSRSRQMFRVPNQGEVGAVDGLVSGRGGFDEAVCFVGGDDVCDGGDDADSDGDHGDAAADADDPRQQRWRVEAQRELSGHAAGFTCAQGDARQQLRHRRSHHRQRLFTAGDAQPLRDLGVGLPFALVEQLRREHPLLADRDQRADHDRFDPEGLDDLADARALDAAHELSLALDGQQRAHLVHARHAHAIEFPQRCHHGVRHHPRPAFVG